VSPETIIAIPHPEIVLVVEEDPIVVNVATEGLQGRPGLEGPPGPDFRYVHNQLVPATVWTIVHNLNGFPNVATVDSSGKEVIGDVEWLDANTVQAAFTAAFGGKAYLS
jgi:hypothetical protein